MLSDRLRPDVECAPWVIDEVKSLEAQLVAVSERLKSSADANTALLLTIDRMAYLLRKYGHKNCALDNGYLFCDCGIDNMLLNKGVDK